MTRFTAKSLELDEAETVGLIRKVHLFLVSICFAAFAALIMGSPGIDEAVVQLDQILAIHDKFDELVTGYAEKSLAEVSGAPARVGSKGLIKLDGIEQPLVVELDQVPWLIRNSSTEIVRSSSNQGDAPRVQLTRPRTLDEFEDFWQGASEPHRLFKIKPSNQAITEIRTLDTQTGAPGLMLTPTPLTIRWVESEQPSVTGELRLQEWATCFESIFAWGPPWVELHGEFVWKEDHFKDLVDNEVPTTYVYCLKFGWGLGGGGSAKFFFRDGFELEDPNLRRAIVLIEEEPLELAQDLRGFITQSLGIEENSGTALADSFPELMHWASGRENRDLRQVKALLQRKMSGEISEISVLGVKVRSKTALLVAFALIIGSQFYLFLHIEALSVISPTSNRLAPWIGLYPSIWSGFALFLSVCILPVFCVARCVYLVWRMSVFGVLGLLASLLAGVLSLVLACASFYLSRKVLRTRLHEPPAAKEPVENKKDSLQL